MFDRGWSAAPDADLLEPWNRPTSSVRPNGCAAPELEDATLNPADLTDADVVEAIRAFDHLVSWAGLGRPACWPSSPAVAPRAEPM
jgi:hypothetical protein